MSEATLQKFIDLEFVSSFKDIYHLGDHYSELIKIEGFGKKSIDKLLNSIEKSRNTTLSRLIYALSIPLVGKTVSKALETNLGKDEFLKVAYLLGFRGVKIDKIGNEITLSLDSYFRDHKDEFFDLLKEFTITESSSNTSANSGIAGKTFVITGSVERFKNRNELKDKIENLGGKVASAVSAKTDYLINNDINSKSSKNQKAKTLNIPIITEEDFLQLVGDE